MLNIDVNVKPAKQQVDELGTSILGLGAKAAEAGEKVNKSLDFGNSAKKQFKELKKEFASLTAANVSLAKQLGDSAKATTKQADASSFLRQIAATTSKAIVDQTVALRAQTDEIKKSLKEHKALGAQEEKNIQTKNRAAKIIDMVATASSKHGKLVKELTKLNKEGAISDTERARALEMYRKVLRTTGTEAETYLANLKIQNREFNKSSTEILKLRDGWKTLSATQQTASIAQKQLADDIVIFNKNVPSVINALAKYNNEVAALKRLADAGKISQEQFTAALTVVRGALEKASKAEASRNAVKQKTPSLEEAATTALIKHIAELEKSVAVFGRAQSTLLQNQKGWQGLTKAQQDNLTSLSRLQKDLKSVESLTKSQITPLAQYESRLRAVNNARNSFVASGGKVGISAKVEKAAIAAANRELTENIAKTNLASIAAKKLGADYHIAAQGAAVFRASLMGANLGFGIFTSSTILAATAAYGISKALAGAISVGASFEATFTRVAVILKRSGDSDGPEQLAKNIHLIKTQILELAKTTRFTANEVAEATKILAQAGFDTFDIYNILPGTLDLAAIGMIDMAEAADIAANTMYAFGLAGKDMDRVVDVLATTVISSNLTITQLANTLKYVAPIARNAGMSIEETAAAIGTLANVGIKASMAGTSLRSMILRMADPTSAASKAFQTLKVDYKELTKEGIDLKDIMLALSKAMVGLSKTEKLKIFEDLFGRRAVSGAAGIGELIDNVELLEQKFKSIEGTAAAMRKELQDNLEGAFKNLASVIENVGIRAFDSFGGSLQSKVQELANYISANSDKIAAVLANVVNLLATGTEFLINWGKYALLGIAAFTGYKIVASSIALVTKSLISATNWTDTFFKITKKQAAANAASATSLGAYTFSLNSAGVASQGLMVKSAGATGGVTSLGVAARVTGTAISIMGKVTTFAMRALGPISLALSLGFLAFGSSAISAGDDVAQLTGALQNYEVVANRVADLSKSNVFRLASDLMKDSSALDSQIKAQMEKIKELEEAYATARYKAQNPTRTDSAGNLMQGHQDSAIAAEKEAAALRELGLAQTSLFLLKDEQNKITSASIALTERAVISILNESAALDVIIGKLTELSNNKFFDKSLPISGVVGFLKDTTLAFKDYVAEREKALKTQDDANSDAPTNPLGLDPDAAAKIKEVTKALEGYITAYEKGTFSVAGFSRELKEIDSAQKSLAANSAGSIAALKEMGYSADEARKALDYNKEKTVLEALSLVLGESDDRFKNLASSQQKATAGGLDFESAMSLAKTVMIDLKLPAEEANAILGKFEETIKQTADGTLNLQKKLKDFIKSTNEEWAKFIGGESLDTIAKAFSGKAFDALDAVSQKAVAQRRVMTLLGSSYKEVKTEADSLAEFQLALNKTLDGTAESSRLAARYMKQYAESLPTGRLEKENANLRNQITLTNYGTEALELYTMAYSDFNGELDKVTPGYLAAAQANIKYREELKRTQEVQAAFSQFADGLAKTFSEAFTGGIKSFKDFASELKDLFKNLLKELVYLAIKNKFLDILSQRSSNGNSGGGFLASLASLIAGNNQQQGASTSSAGNSGSWVQLASSFLGGSGATATTGGGSTGGGGGLDFGSLIGAYLQSSTGATTTSGSAGYGNWISALSGTGGNTYSQLGNIYSSFFGSTATAANSVGPLASGYLYGGAGAASGAPAAFSGLGTTSYTGMNTLYGSGQGMYAAPASTGASSGSALGGFGTAVAGLAGAYYGYNRTNGGMDGVAAAASYGALGIGVAGTAAGVAGGASLGVAAGGAYASIGAASWIPIVGWILAALAVIDLASGGKLFGTKFRPESANSSIGVNAEGGTASLEVTKVRNRSLFRGRTWTTETVDAGPEAREAAQEFFRALTETSIQAARAMSAEVVPVITASIETITKYTKKGKEDGTEIFVEYLGQRWKEVDGEAAAMRVSAEQLIAQVAGSVGNVAGIITSGIQLAFEEIVTEINPDNFGESIAKIAYAGGNRRGEDGFDDGGGNGGAGRGSNIPREVLANEAMLIAERWRDSAEMLMEGAQFLVVAQGDINKGNGLLRESGPMVLTRTTNLIEALQRGEETLTETYQRLIQNTALIEQTLGGFNFAFGRTREEFIEFGTDIVDAFGGLDNASAALSNFASVFAGFEGFGSYRREQAYSNRTTVLGSVGLDAETSVDEFLTAFLAAADSLTASQVADWVNAGNAIGQVSIALDQFRERLTGGASLVEDIQAQIQAIAELGASERELAEARQIGNDIIQQAISDFMFGIEGQLAAFEGRTYTHQLEEISRAMNQALKEGQRLGVGEENLNRIRQLAAYQIQDVIAKLRASIASIREQLYGGQDQNQEQVTQQEDLTSQINAQFEASQRLYDSEMQRYEDAQDAIKTIKKFLDDLAIGDLSPEDWRGRLSSAGGTFQETLALAQSGDSDALSQITGAAQDYLGLASEFFGSTTDYADIYNYVTGALRGLQNSLSQVQQPTPVIDPSTVTGSIDGSTTGTGVVPTVQTVQDAGERYQLALQLAQEIGQLGLALDVSVFDLLESFGISLTALSTDLGVTFEEANQATLTNLRILAEALGIGVFDIITALDINFLALTEQFGVISEEIVLGNYTALAEFSAAIGLSMTETIGLMGITFQEIAAGLGADIRHINEETIPILASIAESFDISILALIDEIGFNLGALATQFGFDLKEQSRDNFTALRDFSLEIGENIVLIAERLGTDVTWLATNLANTISDSLVSLPEVPDDIVNGISPFLEAIRNADTSELLNQAMVNLVSYVSNLPEAQASALAPLLNSFGFELSPITDGLTAQTNAVVAAINSSASIATDMYTSLDNFSSISDSNQTAIRDAITTTNDILEEIRDNPLTGTSQTPISGPTQPPRIPPGEFNSFGNSSAQTNFSSVGFSSKQSVETEEDTAVQANVLDAEIIAKLAKLEDIETAILALIEIQKAGIEDNSGKQSGQLDQLSKIEKAVKDKNRSNK